MPTKSFQFSAHLADPSTHDAAGYSDGKMGLTFWLCLLFVLSPAIMLGCMFWKH